MELTRIDSPVDIKLLPTGIIAVFGTILFYLMIAILFGGRYLGELFLDRGSVPYGVTLLALWTITILGFKVAILVSQHDYLRHPALPMGRGKMSPQESEVTHNQLQEHCQQEPRNLYVRRIAVAMETFTHQQRIGAVLEAAENQASLDRESVESSHAMLKAFVWAIPILGFVGTVLGIGGAVEDFSEAVGVSLSIEAVKASIGGVTEGLALAFDTTLLALVFSIVVMLPATLVQKAEEDLLALIDSRSRRELVLSLDDKDAISQQTERDLRDTITEEMEKHQETLETWAEKVENMADKMGRTVAEAHQRHLGELDTLRADHQANLAEEQGALFERLLAGLERSSMDYWNGRLAEMQRLEKEKARARRWWWPWPRKAS